jgi:hypothetical protein
MEHPPKIRHVVGFRHGLYGQSLNDFSQLQKLYSATIPAGIRDFLISFADSVLYYRFDAPTRSGKTKAYSHFVLTNIGPELNSSHPFPASLIGWVVRYRGMGLPDGYLPLMMDSGKTTWLWCDLSHGGSAVVVPKGTREFGVEEKEWTAIASSFDGFIEGLRLDLSPLSVVFRVAGADGLNSTMCDWLQAAVGERWKDKLPELIQAKRRKGV